MIIEEIVAWFYAFTQTYGYLGALVLSFISCLIIFIPIPYLLIVFWLSAPGFGLDPTILALVSALGATFGKSVIYYLGFGGRKLVGEERRRKLEYARLVMDRYGALAIFFFAATPVPDDALYIPLGMMGYSILKFFLLVFLGKFIMTLVITWGGYFAISWIGALLGGGGGIITLAITLIFIISSIYMTLKIDWEKIFVKYVSKKVKALEKIEAEEGCG